MLVAFKEFMLAGHRLTKGDPVPDAAWKQAGERNRRAMLAGRYVMTTDTAVKTTPAQSVVTSPAGGNPSPFRCPVARCEGRVLATKAALATHLSAHTKRGEYTPPKE